MKRKALTEKILDIKRDKGWTWKHITQEIGGMSEVLVVGALLGQMKLLKPLAKKAAELFGLSESEERMLNEVPMRGIPTSVPLPQIHALTDSRISGSSGWVGKTYSRSSPRPPVRSTAILFPLFNRDSTMTGNS